MVQFLSFSSADLCACPCRVCPLLGPSAAEADAAHLEAKLLVASAKVHRRHVDDGQQLGRRSADLQNGLLLTFPGLRGRRRSEVRTVKGDI